MKRILPLLLAALLLALGGCGMGGSIDELYSLPQMADEYVELQRAIDAVLDDGAVYSAPVDGVHRQSVQLCDLNGDGEEEAAAFAESMSFFVPEPSKAISSILSGPTGFTVRTVPPPKALCSTRSPTRGTYPGAALFGAVYRGLGAGREGSGRRGA